MQRDSQRKRFPLADRVIEVVDDTLTGEVLLDEALKMMKSSEKMSVSSWIDLMSGTLYPNFPVTRTASYHDLLCPNANATWTWGRGNMEPNENWLPAQTSPREAGQGPCG